MVRGGVRWEPDFNCGGAKGLGYANVGRICELEAIASVGYLRLKS